MKPIGRLKHIMVLIIAVIGSSNLFSQSDSGTSQDTTSVGPKAIPVISVITEMEEVRQTIDDAETQLIPRKSLADFDSLIPTYDTLIEERRAKVVNLINSNPSRLEVEDYIVTWRSYRSYLRGQMTSINTYLTRLSILEEDIKERSQVWILTQDSALEREAPERIQGSIREIRSELSRISDAISDQNNHFLQLESRLDEQISQVNSVIGELEVLRDSEVFNLFYLRNPPLWKTVPDTEAETEAVKTRSETFSSNLTAIGEMFDSNENTIYLFIILLLIIIGIVLLVRRSFINYEFTAATKRLEYAKEVIVRSPALVILFVAFLVFWYLFKNTPKLFDDISVLLLLIT